MTAESPTDRPPVAPDEDEQEPDPAVLTQGREPRPWIVVGLVFLVLFLAILAWVVLPPID